jgi:hypothetical protein
MAGTAIFLWHDGKPRYDMVIWDPKPVTPEQAVRIATMRMQKDRRATRIQVAYSDSEFHEVVRPTQKLFELAPGKGPDSAQPAQ